MSVDRFVSMRSRAALCGVAILLAVSWPQAQTAPQVPGAAGLPVRRVVLYKSGVGYFEHVGRVRGNQNVTIDFTSGQLDDVLKSITALDLTGGRVSSVQYNTTESLERRLGALSLPLNAQPTRLQFLSALRGANVEVGSGASRVTGRLLSVDTRPRTTNGVSTSVEVVSLVTDAGEMQTIALEPGVNIRFLDRALSEEVSKYLSVMASARERDVRRLSIAASGTGDRDLFVSYVSEVPVWKATYRLVMPEAGEAGKPLIQGWAIVDNTVGEDWTNVQMSLVAGAPQAFIQEISKPYYVRRPVVPLPDRFLLAPQTHGSAVTVSGGVRTDTPTPAMPASAPRALAESVNTTIDGVAKSSVLRSNDGAFSRVTPRLDAVSEVTLNSAVQQARQNQLTEADAASLGDLFEYKMKEPITIRRGQSALVPILSSEITAEKVSLWNFDTGAHSRRAVRAFWLTNSTGMTLDGGSFSIVEGRAFAGEGLMDPIKAGERRLLSYAVDLGLTLDWSEEARPTRTSTVKVLNGTLVLRSEEQRRRTYTARNQDAERKVLVIEHRKDDEFTVVSETKPVESTADFHRFRVTIEPNATATLVVDEVRPTETTFRVADMMDAHVEFLVSTKAMSPGLEAGLKEVLARKADVARLTAEGARRRTEIDQITKDQERLRENMKSLKGSAEERQLLQRYVRQLNEQENRIEALRGEAQAIAGQIEKARAELVRAIEAVR